MLNKIPKVELHCHLIGVVNANLLRQLQHQNEPILVNPYELDAIYPINGRQGFTQWLNVTRPYQNADYHYFLPIIRSHIKHLIAQNVCYTEIMISPTMFPQAIDDALKSFSTFREEVTKMEEDKLQVEFNMVIPRSLESDKIQQDTQKYLEFYAAGFTVGVAIVGLENQESLAKFTPDLERIKKSGMGIEIHAGEHSGPEAVLEAIEIGLADRIGHGIGAFEDESVIKKIVDKNIHLEFCLTSNLRMKSVDAILSHPMGTAIKSGINFSINTDDPGIFECTLTDEFDLATRIFALNHDDLITIFKNSLRSRFQPNLKYTEPYQKYIDE